MSLKKNKRNQTEQLLGAIRRCIVDGQFLPGEQLPSFSQMEVMFRASRGALQIALEPLKQQGFILSKPRKGLFVNPQPPHLRRYGLLFPCNPGDNQWSRLNDALLKVAHHIEKHDKEGRQFVHFMGLTDPSMAKITTEAIAEQVSTAQLAGLILTPDTFKLAELHPFCERSIPKVYMFGDSEKKQIPCVAPKGLEIIQSALTKLRNRKRTRIAVLHIAGTFSKLNQSIFEACNTTYHSKWIQSVPRKYPETVGRLLSLLFDYPEDQRPDGLIIADDNLVEHTVRALVELGLHPGRDLDVIAHCNWPWPVPSVVPMQRIGFHAADLLINCISIIDAMRSGKKYPKAIKVGALFEEEVKGDEDLQQQLLTLGNLGDILRA